MRGTRSRGSLGAEGTRPPKLQRLDSWVAAELRGRGGRYGGEEVSEIWGEGSGGGF